MFGRLLPVKAMILGSAPAAPFGMTIFRHAPTHFPTVRRVAGR